MEMPLFFTSTALMPYDKMSGWLMTVASVNPSQQRDRQREGTFEWGRYRGH
jgi:hypothetical protein